MFKYAGGYTTVTISMRIRLVSSHGVVGNRYRTVLAEQARRDSREEKKRVCSAQLCLDFCKTKKTKSVSLDFPGTIAAANLFRVVSCRVVASRFFVRTAEIPQTRANAIQPMTQRSRGLARVVSIVSFERSGGVYSLSDMEMGGILVKEDTVMMQEKLGKRKKEREKARRDM